MRCPDPEIQKKIMQEGALIRRWENLFGQISKPSLVPNISFNFKDSLCHIVSGGACVGRRRSHWLPP